MRAVAAALLLLLAASRGVYAGGAREKPGDARFEVTDRVEELRLPISAAPVTISLWTPLPAAAGVSNLAESPLFREAVRRTGVTVRFVHPPAAGEAAALAALAASGSLPDTILTDWTRYPGGPSRAIADELIVPLNDVIETWMPDYRTMLARAPSRARALRTDEGYYYGFPLLAWSADPETALAIGATEGLAARGDILERLKISRLDTMDDWDAALRLIKKERGIDTPLLLRLSDLELTHLFASGHGASFGFFQTDGRVGYGPLQPGFRDFLALLAAWVKDGLVNADFGTVDLRTSESRIVQGKAAAWVASADAMPRLAAALRAREPKAAIVALAPPVKTAGELALLGANEAAAGVIGGRWLALGAKNAKLKVSALWVDFWYSDQGSLLQRRFDARLTLFGRFDTEGWRARLPAIAGSPGLAEAQRLWSRAATADHALPPLWPAGGEAALEADVLPKAAALVEEMTVKIATGAQPLESFADYAERINGLGMPRLLAAKQAELDRALRR